MSLGSPPEDPDAARLLEMRREPRWAGGRLRLVRRPRQGAGTPLWVSFGLRTRWRTEVVLTVTALLTAAGVCGLLALAVFLPGEAR